MTLDHEAALIEALLAEGIPLDGHVQHLDPDEYARRQADKADNEAHWQAILGEQHRTNGHRPAIAVPDDPTPERPTPLPTLPDHFWTARPHLQQIRQAAHANTRSCDVAFHTVLARLAAMGCHWMHADTGVGGLASLNYYVAIVGDSGAGKSSGQGTGRNLLPAPAFLPFADEQPIGTGEGLAEAYMGDVEEERPGKGNRTRTIRVRAQVRNNALFYVDEGETIAKLVERAGTTIGESLRRAWTGQTLGQRNGRSETTRIIERGSYRMGIIIGFQPSTAGPLLADAGAGTPQRFLWCATADPTIPDDAPEWPGPLDVDPRLVAPGSGPHVITFAPAIRAEIRAVDLARARGELTVGNPLNSHEGLARVKVAALLAQLDGRLGVAVDDWELAKVVWDTSCAVRDAVVEQVAAAAARTEQERADAYVAVQERVTVARSSAEAKAVRIAGLIADHVRQAGVLSRSDARRKLALRDRHLFGEALESAARLGWVVVGEKLTPGKVE